jgi:hypothetical protein
MFFNINGFLPIILRQMFQVILRDIMNIWRKIQRAISRQPKGLKVVEVEVDFPHIFLHPSQP